MGDMFPMMSKFTKLQFRDKEQQHMFNLSRKEELVRSRNEVHLYRKQVTLSEDVLKCADLVHYLDTQKLLNLKIATSTIAECAMLDRRLSLAKDTEEHIQMCLELLQELVAKFDQLYVCFLRDVAKAMNFENPKDIVNRHTTLTMVKHEALGEYHHIHAKLHALKEKDAGVREERLKKSLILYNQKRELFQQCQELEEKNIQLAGDVKAWEGNSNTTQRVLIQATCHIQQAYSRLLANRRTNDYSKPKTNVMDMLEEISKEIKKKSNTLASIASYRNRPDSPSRRGSLPSVQPANEES